MVLKKSSMKHTLIVIFSLLGLISCKKHPVEFIAGGNDVADIRLTLKVNNTFDLAFRSMLDSEDTVSIENKKYIFTGTWKTNNHFYELEFKKDSNDIPNVMALFNPIDNPGILERINHKSVKFKEETEHLVIWGVERDRQ